MQRRDFIRAFATASAAFATLRSVPAWADISPVEAFDANVARHPWLTPFKGVSDATQDLRCESLAVTGRWPKALTGRFYRNGPALFERNGQRYGHWFDGDGMVQQFTFDGRKVSHLGRLVRTNKLLEEQKAGRFLHNAFGTAVAGAAPAQGPDSYNVANTSVIELAGRVLALWEGGSAFALDPQDLSTQGAVTWREGFEQVPFSAHPKLGRDGHLWNIGASGDRLIAWHIGPDGKLADVQIGESPYPRGMVHDMAVTEQYLVVPLPPVRFHFGQASESFKFEPNEPLRILVMRKDDITQRRLFELPSQVVFHVGNAYERRDGSIALSFVAASDNAFLVHGATAPLRGEPSNIKASSTQLAVLDMRSGRAECTSMKDAVEFPRIDPRRIGLQARYLVSASAPGVHKRVEGTAFHGIQLRDLDTGRASRFDYGEHSVVEEHILVPKPGSTRELDAWLVGTTFDAKRQVTLVNVLEASRIADGPIAQAALPYKLPLGFHGNFYAARA